MGLCCHLHAASSGSILSEWETLDGIVPPVCSQMNNSLTICSPDYTGLIEYVCTAVLCDLTIPSKWVSGAFASYWLEQNTEQLLQPPTCIVYPCMHSTHTQLELHDMSSGAYVMVCRGLAWEADPTSWYIHLFLHHRVLLLTPANSTRPTGVDKERLHWIAAFEYHKLIELHMWCSSSCSPLPTF